MSGNADTDQPSFPLFYFSFASLIECGWALRKAEFREITAIVERCRERLQPLGEPLEHGIGLNRWLAAAREESYSDWLQWLFSQMKVGELADVLGLRDAAVLNPAISDERVQVDREWWVEHGHEGRSGRLDILLRLGTCAVVVLEVKLGAADNSDLEKQKGYVRSFENDPEFLGRRRYYRLLVTIASQDSYYKFTVITHSSFCLNLRRLAAKWLSHSDANLYTAALTLTLVAALEINLLRLSVQSGDFTPATVRHLKKFVEDRYCEQ